MFDWFGYGADKTQKENITHESVLSFFTIMAFTPYYQMQT